MRQVQELKVKGSNYLADELILNT